MIYIEYTYDAHIIFEYTHDIIYTYIFYVCI